MDSQTPDERPSKMICFDRVSCLLKLVMDSEKPDEMICFDRLSDLPDELLEKILLFLPTKNAFGASILSKRWNNLNPFGGLPIHLHLDESQFIQHDGSEYRHLRSFDKFVDKLFNETLRDVPSVESMTLKCDYEALEYQESKSLISACNFWISAAINLKVKTLILSLRRLETDTLFEQLDGNTALLCLELFSPSHYDKPLLLIRHYFESLPSLKRLHLNKFEFTCNMNYKSIGDLVDCCHALEELEIVDCSLDYKSSLCIQSPTLKSLTIEDTCFDSEYNLVLVHNIPNLTSAHLNFHTRDGHVSKNIGKIIAACSSTKSLYISFNSITDLHFISLQLPVFKNLIRLSLGYLKNDGWTVFASLLKSAPMLEHLTFGKGLPETGFETFERLLASPPTCLEMHIKSIEFRRFRWEPNEVNVLNYFKQSGKVLERLVVNSFVVPIAK